jgi:hypothetical protein
LDRVFGEGDVSDGAVFGVYARDAADEEIGFLQVE